MKRSLSFLLALCVMLSSFVLVSVAADNGFDIENGVLLRYSGSASDVVIPDGVYAVGDSAFKGNTTLKSVTLPNGVYQIGEMAFYGCKALSTVKGGTDILQIGTLAFAGTPYFDCTTQPYVVLGKVLLWYNGPSTNAILPAGCVSIAPYAFAKSNIRYFRADDGLLSIGTGAFYNCTALSIVSIPASVTDIGAYAFDGTPYLESLGDFPIMGDGVLVKYRGTDAAVSIPDTVRRIASNAFGGLSKLSSVTIPSSVYSIDPYAFAECVGLSELRWSDGLSNIGDGAFRGCRSLTSLETPDTLAYIGQYAFSGCTSITDMSLFGSGLSVSHNAFKGCTALRCALLTDHVTALYDDAFSGCTALEGISIAPDTVSVGANSLRGCGKVTVVCDQGSVAASALTAYNVDTAKGDVNGDEECNIIDVSVLQSYLVGRMSIDGARRAAADVDYDGVVMVVDATKIQRELAHFV